MTTGVYQCTLVARMPGIGTWDLAGYWARSPRLALRWMRGQALRLAEGLDPIPDAGCFPAGCLRKADPDAPHPGAIFRAWAEDTGCQEQQMVNLASGHPVTIAAGGPDRIVNTVHADTFYALSARLAYTCAPPHRIPEFAAA